MPGLRRPEEQSATAAARPQQRATSTNAKTKKPVAPPAEKKGASSANVRRHNSTASSSASSIQLLLPEIRPPRKSPVAESAPAQPHSSSANLQRKRSLHAVSDSNRSTSLRRRGSQRVRGPGPKQQARNNAARAIQQWWRRAYLRRNFYKLVHRARDWAEEEERQRRARSQRAREILLSFVRRCAITLKFRRKQRQRARVEKATALVNVFLRVRRADIAVNAKILNKQVAASLVILAQWKQSKIFARVRWRKANETFQDLLLQEEVIERRFLETDAGDERLRLTRDFGRSESFVQWQQSTAKSKVETAAVAAVNEAHAVEDEAKFGDAASSVATIKRQRAAVIIDATAEADQVAANTEASQPLARATSSGNFGFVKQRVSTIAAFNSQPSSGGCASPRDKYSALSKNPRQRRVSIGHASGGAFADAALSFALTSSPDLIEALNEIGETPLLRSYVNKTLNNGPSGRTRFAHHNQRYLQPRRVDPAKQLFSGEKKEVHHHELLYKSGVSETFLGDDWASWFAQVDVSPAGMRQQAASDGVVRHAEVSVQFEDSLSKSTKSSSKNRRDTVGLPVPVSPQAGAGPSAAAEASSSLPFAVDVEFELERMLLQEFSRRLRLETQSERLTSAIFREMERERQKDLGDLIPDVLRVKGNEATAHLFLPNEDEETFF